MATRSGPQLKGASGDEKKRDQRSTIAFLPASVRSGARNVASSSTKRKNAA
ncbi:MAG: hypothetical protein QOE82_982 [Thermoanaerobaculia bacterium]|nr:hypothetical protein [Thermoanaerobaculia bacterium]